MKDSLDLRTDRERIRDRTSYISKLIILAVIAATSFFFFSGCMGLEEVTDLADNRFDAVEDLGRLGRNVAREYEDARKVRRYYSRASYLASFVNQTCSSYEGEDESGNHFVIPAQGITNVKVKAISRRDRDVSVFLIREEIGTRDCAGPTTYSGEVGRNGEVTLR